MQRIKVHYKGWASKFDEVIDISDMESVLDCKIAEIGKFSTAYGQAKFKKSDQKHDHDSRENTEDRKSAQKLDEENLKAKEL